MPHRCVEPRLIACSIVLVALLLGTSLPLNAQPIEQPQELKGHLDTLNAGVFTPTGDQVITASSDHTAVLWDRATGAILRKFEAHTGPILSLAVSGDGRVLVTGSQDNQARVWQLPPVAPSYRLPATPPATPAPLTQLTLGAGGAWLVWATPQGELAFTDPSPTLIPANIPLPADPQSPLTVATRKPTDQGVSKIAIRPDGVWLAQGTNSGEVLVASPYIDGVQAHFRAHTSPIVGLSFRSDNQRIVTLAADGTWAIWQFAPRPETPAEPPVVAEGAEPVVDPNQGTAPWIVSVIRQGKVDVGAARGGEILGASAQFVAWGEADRIAFINTDADEDVKVVSLEGQIPACIAIRPDGQRMAIALKSQQVKIIQPANAELVQNLELDAPPIALTYTADNQRLAVSCGAGGLRVYGPPQPAITGTELVEDQRCPAANLNAIVASSDNRAIWGSTDAGLVERWSIVSPRQIFQLNHGGAVYSISINKSGSRIVTCGADQQVRVFDGTNGQQKFQLSGHQGPVLSVSMSSDETLAVSSGSDGTLRLWDVVGGRSLKQLAKLDENQYAVAISPDGTRLASCGADRLVHLFDLQTGAEQRVLEGHGDFVNTLSFSPSGQRLASYGYAGELRIWSVADGTALVNSKVATVGNGIAYSQDGSRLLLTCGDGIARIVEVPANAK